MTKNLKVWGKVKKGQHRGKLLGFPTANINLFKKIEQGIYISNTKLGNTIYPSVTFIGNATTFGETDIKAETYILNFNKNIYGQYITINLLKKLRENVKFSSESDLKKQMRKDLKEAREYFSLQK